MILALDNGGTSDPLIDFNFYKCAVECEIKNDFSIPSTSDLG
jgi:hypothetical protein